MVALPGMLTAAALPPRMSIQPVSHPSAQQEGQAAHAQGNQDEISDVVVAPDVTWAIPCGKAVEHTEVRCGGE